MDPEELSPTSISSLEPNFFKKGNFFVFFLRKDEEKPFFLRFSFRKFKIFSHTHGKSLGIELAHSNDTEEEKSAFLSSLKLMEKRIQKLAIQNKNQIKFKFEENDFHLIKTDRSEKNKIFAKIPDKKCTFWVLDGETKKKTNPLKFIDSSLLGDVIVEVRQIFISNIKTITCVVKEVLIREEEKPPSFFDDFADEDEEEED